MAKTYFPNDSTVIYVNASKPHPDNTQYKISRGIEYWGDEGFDVIKVQMVYDGVIAGRRSPSYPVGTDDHQKVIEAINKLNGEV